MSYDNLEHKCFLCIKTFTSKGNLEKHYESKIHKNKIPKSPDLNNVIILPYECEICNKKYVDKRGLNLHNSTELHKKTLKNFN